MMLTIRKWSTMTLFFFFIQLSISKAQFYNGLQMDFGKNRIQYNEFLWQSMKFEKFDTYSEPADDFARMHAVQFDNCKYYSIYETDKGNIQLSIEHDGVTKCFVMLSYYDKINSEIIKTKAIDDL